MNVNDSDVVAALLLKQEDSLTSKDSAGPTHRGNGGLAVGRVGLPDPGARAAGTVRGGLAASSPSGPSTLSAHIEPHDRTSHDGRTGACEGSDCSDSGSRQNAGSSGGGGFRLVGSAGEADVVLLNTCAVREQAEARIWGRLRELKGMRRQRREEGRRPLAVVGVLGCMAERLKGALLSHREGLADLVAGPDAYRDLPRLIRGVQRGELSGPAAMNVALSLEETYADVAPVRRTGTGVSAFVTIMRGCNNMCSFCVVPYTRGRERSRPLESILSEVRSLAAEGVREVVLLGQNVNSYADWSGTAAAAAAAGGEQQTEGTGAGEQPAAEATAPSPPGEGGGTAGAACGSGGGGGGPTGLTAAAPAAAAPQQASAPSAAPSVETHGSGGPGPAGGPGPGGPGGVYAPGFRSVYRPQRRGSTTFAQLLRAVAAVHPEVRVRFTSPHPKEFSGDVLQAICDHPNICKQLHMPAQSGSTPVLGRMRRGYSREAYDNLVAAVRARLPGVALSTDIIVGFSGETDADHAATRDLLAATQYDNAFIFAYSERARTHAARHLPDDVPPATKSQRLQEALAAFRAGRDARSAAQVGKVHLVLVEKRRATTRGSRCGSVEDPSRVVTTWVGRTCTGRRAELVFGRLARNEGCGEGAGRLLEYGEGSEEGRVGAVEAGGAGLRLPGSLRGLPYLEELVAAVTGGGQRPDGTGPLRTSWRYSTAPPPGAVSGCSGCSGEGDNSLQGIAPGRYVAVLVTGWRDGTLLCHPLALTTISEFHGLFGSTVPQGSLPAGLRDRVVGCSVQDGA